MSLDASGNVFVTGNNRNSGGGFNALTVKYSPSGAILWRARDEPGANESTQGLTAKATSDGGVVVSGTYADLTAGYVLLVKYDVNGAQLWRNTVVFGATATSPHMTLDAAGNIFVATSISTNNTLAIVTLKFDAAGNEIWRRTVAAPAGGADTLYALAADANGNIFVAGTRLSGAPENILLVKYDSSGVEQWVVTADGAAAGIDTARALIVDAAGNAYVAADTQTSQNNRDWLTLKFNANGIEQWRATLTNPVPGMGLPHDIRLDSGGNVFVVGERQANGTAVNSAVTVKYDNLGVEQWNRVIDGDPYMTESMAAGVVTPNGDIVVTGASFSATTFSDFRTIRYDADGNEVFRVRTSLPGDAYHLPVAIAVDGNGDLLVAGNSGANPGQHDFLTVKYSGAGIERWHADEGIDNRQYAVAETITTDLAGNTYIAASAAINSSSQNDFLVLKLDPSGSELWRVTIDGIAHEDDRPVAIALDQAGNVVVTGFAKNLLTGLNRRDFLTIKFNPAGVEQWRAVSDGIDQREDSPFAMALDSAGNVYVTGSSYDSTNQAHFMTIKYSAGGSELWRKILAVGYDLANSIAIDQDGNVVVAGTTSGASGGPAEGIVVVKYAPGGAELWRKALPARQLPAGVRVDRAGFVYVAGTAANATDTEIIVARFDPAGNEQWRKSMNNVVGKDDSFRAMAVDAVGNVFVSGSTYIENGRSVTFTFKLNESGAEQWRASTDGAALLGAELWYGGIAVDANGSAYVTGNTTLSGTGRSALAIKYSSHGNELWRWEPGVVAGKSRDYGKSIALDPAGNVLLASDSTGTPDSALEVVKLSQTGTVTVPVLMGAVSRKTHALVGTFDMPLYLGGNISDLLSVEPRQSADGHRIVLQFNAPVTMPGVASARDASGQAVGTASAELSGNDVAVRLTDVPDNQRVIVAVSGVNGLFDFAVPLSFQAGNILNPLNNVQFVSGSAVTASDISAFKARAASMAGAYVSATNFLFDINLDGVVGNADIALVKSRSGQALH